MATQRVSEDDGLEPDVASDDDFVPSEVALEPLADASVVHLCGDVDLSLSDALAAACASAIDRGLPIRLDLSQVTFIDSTALGFVARLASAEREQGRTLHVQGASRRSLDTIRLIGLQDVLDLDGVSPS